jgi:hypothetical protein
MTTTAGAPPQQQPPPQPPSETAVIAALTVVALTTQPIVQATAQVWAILAPLGIGPDIAKLAAGLALTAPLELPQSIGPALAHTRRTGMPRRAAYLLAAARRLNQGGDVEAERRYLGQHLDAERSRVEASQRVDRASAEHGPVLGWKARMDDITTAACRAANGADFQADHPPRLPRTEDGHELVGFPGTLHGGSCRCIPGPPWGSGRMLV